MPGLNEQQPPPPEVPRLRNQQSQSWNQNCWPNNSGSKIMLLGLMPDFALHVKSCDA